MFIKEVMTNEVETGELGMTLQEAAKKMRDGRFGSLPIAEDDRLVGMLTDRDITVRAVAEGLDVKSVKVSEVMSAKILYCYEDQTIEEVTHNLGDNKIRRLPVLNRQKRLVGILSLGDLAQDEDSAENVEKALARISKAQSGRSETHLY